MCPCLMRARLCTFPRACLLAWAATGRRTWCGNPYYLRDFGKWLFGQKYMAVANAIVRSPCNKAESTQHEPRTTWQKPGWLLGRFGSW